MVQNGVVPVVVDVNQSLDPQNSEGPVINPTAITVTEVRESFHEKISL